MSKYRNRRTVVDNLTFASAKEARHYQHLKLRQQAGEIQDLQWQVPFRLSLTGAQGEFSCAYIADFTYITTASGEFHVHDTKGMKTPMYRLKSKLFRCCYGWHIEEG